MSAQHIFDDAILGSIIRYSDGTPRPPARFVKKVEAWERNNGVGQLVGKTSATQRATYSAPASVTLLHGNYASGGVVVLTVHHIHLVTSLLAYTLEKRPSAGSFLVTRSWGGATEFLHLAGSPDAAEAWLRRNPHSDAVVAEVPAYFQADRAGPTSSVSPAPSPELPRLAAPRLADQASAASSPAASVPAASARFVARLGDAILAGLEPASPTAASSNDSVSGAASRGLGSLS